MHKHENIKEYKIFSMEECTKIPLCVSNSLSAVILFCYSLRFLSKENYTMSLYIRAQSITYCTCALLLCANCADLTILCSSLSLLSFVCLHKSKQTLCFLFNPMKCCVSSIDILSLCLTLSLCPGYRTVNSVMTVNTMLKMAWKQK